MARRPMVGMALLYGLILAQLIFTAGGVAMALVSMMAQGAQLRAFVAVPRGSPVTMLRPLVGREVTRREVGDLSGERDLWEVTFEGYDCATPCALVDGSGGVIDTWVSAVGMRVSLDLKAHLKVRDLTWALLLIPIISRRAAHCGLLIAPLVMVAIGFDVTWSVLLFASFVAACLLRREYSPADEAHVGGMARVCVLICGPLVTCLASGLIVPVSLFGVTIVPLLVLVGLAAGYTAANNAIGSLSQ